MQSFEELNNSRNHHFRMFDKGRPFLQDYNSRFKNFQNRFDGEAIPTLQTYKHLSPESITEIQQTMNDLEKMQDYVYGKEREFGILYDCPLLFDKRNPKVVVICQKLRDELNKNVSGIFIDYFKETPGMLKRYLDKNFHNPKQLLGKIGPQNLNCDYLDRNNFIVKKLHRISSELKAQIQAML